MDDGFPPTLESVNLWMGGKNNLSLKYEEVIDVLNQTVYSKMMDDSDADSDSESMSFDDGLSSLCSKYENDEIIEGISTYVVNNVDATDQLHLCEKLRDAGCDDQTALILRGFENMKQCIDIMEHSRAMLANQTRTALLAASMDAEMTKRELKQLWECESRSDTFAKRKEIRLALDSGKSLHLMDIDLYEGCGRYPSDMDDLIREFWTLEMAFISYRDLENRRMDVDVGNGVKMPITKRGMYAADEEELRELYFLPHTDYGGRCMELWGTIPSAKYIDRFRPSHWFYFDQIAMGANEKLHAARRNWVSFGLYLATKNASAAGPFFRTTFELWLENRFCGYSHKTSKCEFCTDACDDCYFACMNECCTECTYNGYLVTEDVMSAFDNCDEEIEGNSSGDESDEESSSNDGNDTSCGSEADESDEESACSVLTVDESDEEMSAGEELVLPKTIGDIKASKTFLDENVDFEYELNDKIKFWEYETMERITANGKKWKYTVLCSSDIKLSDFLVRWEEQLGIAKSYWIGAKLQSKTLKSMTKNGGSCLPSNSVVITSDFSTNVKKRTSEYMSCKEWRSAEEMNLECQLVNFKTIDEKQKPNSKRTRLSLDSGKPELQEFAFHYLGDTHKHDAYTHDFNYQNTIEFVRQKMEEIDIIYKNSDGSGKEYKGVPALVNEKLNCIKYGINTLKSFYCTETGKGKWDSLNGIVQRDYRKGCLHCLQTDNLDVFKVSDWMNEHRCIPAHPSPESRLQKRIFKGSASDEVTRPSFNPWMSLKGKKNKHRKNGAVTRDMFCFYITSEEGEKNFGVWVRKFTCMECEHCQSGKPLECTLSHKYGKWQFVPFKLTKKGREAKLKTDINEQKKRKNARNGGNLRKKQKV